MQLVDIGQAVEFHRVAEAIAQCTAEQTGQATCDGFVLRG